MSLKHAVLSFVLIASTSVNADTIGWGGGNQNRPNQPSQPTYPTPSIPPFPPSQPSSPIDPWENNDRGNRDSSSVRLVESSVQDYFYGRSQLNLLADYYILSQIQGLKIKEITIIASSEQGQGRAGLILNGQAVGNSVVVARQMRAYTFSVDSLSSTVGQNLRSIQLNMQGRLYVDKVIFTVLETSHSRGPERRHPSDRRQDEPRVEILRQIVNQRIASEGGLEISRLFNLGLERRGQVVKRVIVLARSDRGFGLATLMVNGRQLNSSQNIGMGMSRLIFDLGQGSVIGQDMRALRLLLKGNIVIDEVLLEIAH